MTNFEYWFYLTQCHINNCMISLKGTHRSKILGYEILPNFEIPQYFLSFSPTFIIVENTDGVFIPPCFLQSLAG